MAQDKPTPRKEWWKVFIGVSNRVNLSYYFIRACAFMSCWLPIRVSYAITISAAYFIYFTWGAMRKVVAGNMRRVLGEGADDRTVNRMTRAAFRSYFKFLVEWLRLPKLGPQEVEGLIHAVGWEHLDRALQSGKGVIFCGFHLGNWDLAGAMLAVRGYPVTVVVETFSPPKLNQLIQNARTLKGVKIIPLEQAGMKVIRALRNNEILGLLIDRPDIKDGVPVELCGGITYVPAGAAALALRTGATLLPGFIVRQPDNTFLGTISSPAQIEPTGDFRRDVQALSQKVVACLEGWVRQYPDQWYMFRQVWRTDGIESNARRSK